MPAKISEEQLGSIVVIIAFMHNANHVTMDQGGIAVESEHNLTKIAAQHKLQ